MSHRKTPEQNDARIRALKARLVGVIAVVGLAVVGVGAAALAMFTGEDTPAIAAPSATGQPSQSTLDLVIREVDAEVDIAATEPLSMYEDAAFALSAGVDAVDVSFGTQSGSLTNLEVAAEGGSVEVLLHDGTRRTVRAGTSVDLSFVGQEGGTVVRVTRAGDDVDSDVTVVMRMRRAR